jgi:N6-adenosine-specific RNA methylase IME4
MSVGQTVELRVDAEFKALIPPLSAEERRQLEENLKADGRCIEPLVTWNDTIIDGHNRYEICHEHGIDFETEEREFPDRDACKAWIIRHQFGRRNLSAYQRAELAMKLEPLIAEKAKEKQRDGGREKVVQKSVEPPVKVQVELARVAGVSHDTIHKAKVIAAQATEPVKEKLRSGETSINAVYKDLKREERQKAIIRVATPSGVCRTSLQSLVDEGQKFGCVYADPPWQYGNQATRAATDNHYPTMAVDDICALPVAELAGDNAHLHLWTTNAFLFDAKRVMEAWGFEYKSVMVWVKPQMGIGNYWRVSHEFLLLGIRGSAPFGDRGIKSWLEADRTRHSAKPQEFRSLIERVSTGPFLEMFAREPVKGWTVWGNQIDESPRLIA